MSSAASSNSTQTITNVVFGLTATAISVVTVWQGHRVWMMWREHNNRNEGSMASDIELGLQPVHSTPTSLETPEHEEVADNSTLPAEHAGAVADPEHMSVSIQNTEFQSTLPTTVDAETSLHLPATQGAQIKDNDIPNVDNGNAQPAISNMENGELRPGTNGNHDPAEVH